MKLFSPFLACLLIAIIGSCLVDRTSAEVQRVKVVYDGNPEESEMIRSSVRNATKLRKGKGIISMCTSGASKWVVFEEENFQGRGNSLESSYCIQRHKVLSFRHVGNLETHKPGLSLYEGSEYEGRELYFEGDSLQLLEPFNSSSNCFTGLDRWELYQGPQYDGRSKCLHSLEAAYSREFPKCESGGSTDTFELIASIGRGCHHQQGKVNIHPPNPQRPAPNFITQPYVTLFTEKGNKGEKLHMEGLVLRLPKAYHFESSKVKGQWQTFTGTDFDGYTTCHQSPYDNYFKEDASLDVGSIKRGCGHPVNEVVEDEGEETNVNGSVLKSKSWGLLTFGIFLAIYY